MFSASPANRNIFTVSKLNHLARSVLESEIGQVWLSAEISNFVAASSGHWYFTLKDNRAQIKSAMFKGANRKVMTRPKEGDKVLVRANLSIYEPRGDYQLIVEHLEPEGEGQLKRQFEALKQALSAQGLFASQNKQPLPNHISRIGVVTSATGAALHDILTVLKRRNPAVEVVIYPTQVQGVSASRQICRAIGIANQRKEVDVLIVGRGGGSLEDLWCFNEENVAWAIHNSVLPIVSAVGHEVDVTIADFVADLRAPTPSAAAELVSQSQVEMLNTLLAKRDRLYKNARTLIKELQYQQQSLSQELHAYHPKNQLRQHMQRVDNQLTAITHNMSTRLMRAKQSSINLSSKLSQFSPKALLKEKQQTHSMLSQRLTQAWQRGLEQRQLTLANASHLLDTVSPLSTLARGYSITFKDDKVVKSQKALIEGDVITNRFADGEVKSTVK
ncbi:exodeoxyribonuclease VII large subunit [Paraglaciecola chathamensis]|uniref:Exodeoxyribonuclease 7 large subunit n=1 Tax=Paraglaciecola chathamensis S18K6 TaxID=1127672 RepID=A0AAV3V3B2_9ALTE|nr:exodeoxyribonuclease VII large subunit [Paraglaciecola chathamensis]GAC11374.1 exodeoxyribonuclease VII large subunit [Paraglaciecola chathamensis S18K6]